LLDELPDAPPHQPPPGWGRRLTDITTRALTNRPGVEGGFFLAGEWSLFAGHAFPSDPHAPSEPPPPPGKKHAHPKKGPEKGLPAPPPTPDPPPKEKDFIFAQCQASLTAEADAPPIAATRVIGPSRVLVVTAPVGAERPAPIAAWVMIRLTSPEQLAQDAH